MWARSKFEVGDRVKLNDRGREYYGQFRKKMTCDAGIVIGFSPRRPGCVRIKLDTRTTPEIYDCKFWNMTKRLSKNIIAS